MWLGQKSLLKKEGGLEIVSWTHQILPLSGDGTPWSNTERASPSREEWGKSVGVQIWVRSGGSHSAHPGASGDVGRARRWQISSVKTKRVYGVIPKLSPSSSWNRTPFTEVLRPQPFRVWVTSCPPLDSGSAMASVREGLVWVRKRGWDLTDGGPLPGGKTGVLGVGWRLPFLHLAPTSPCPFPSHQSSGYAAKSNIRKRGRWRGSGKTATERDVGRALPRPAWPPGDFAGSPAP